ncbi:urease accessory protein UreE [[Limnothrix rosea] IAM M-220]|uniref:urease accessory protein UreE n=1 Tax=[Limnothrix rosea] IAM M-220 TaxID=454133 RepID=UPI0009625EFD|nr:urease accessory protein UreE [[Limnothrix rosea] IAM M-220]OKH18290.1 urease accessory protein UreE [[Limnothrix rosea] IAM M-220]
MADTAIILTQKTNDANVNIDFTLALTAEQRAKPRQRIELADGKVIHVQLSRNAHLHAQDYLQTEKKDLTVQVLAQAEPVVTVTSGDRLALLKAAYHLGNRHVPLEVNLHYLRFAPDHVLETMLQNLDVEISHEVVPFFPEHGAYGGHHH